MKVVTTPLRGARGSIWFISPATGKLAVPFFPIPIKRVALSREFADLPGNAAKILTDLMARYQRRLLAKESNPNCLRIETADHERLGMSENTFKTAVKKLQDSHFVELMKETSRRGKWYSLTFVKGWKAGTARFIRFPYQVADSEKFRKLPGNALKLLIQRMAMVSDPESFGSIENGYLDFPLSHFQKWGWKRRSLENALRELVNCGYLIETLPTGCYCVECALVWTELKRREFKPVKGQKSPARYAITWDGYEPYLVKGLVADPSPSHWKNKSDWEDNLDPTPLQWMDDAYQKLNNHMPKSEFPFQAWKDEWTKDGDGFVHRTG